MKKRFITIPFILIFYFIEGQSIYSNNFEIKYKKAYVNTALELHTSRVKIFHVDKKKQKKIQVRFNVKTTTKKHLFDPNKFYLLSKEYKKRLRPADIQKHKSLHFYAPFEYLSNIKTKKEYWFLKHYPNIPDTFLDYKIDGFEDIYNNVNFGTKKEPELYCIYFKPEKIKNKTVDLYFVVPKDFKNGIIYYENQKIKEFSLE